MPERNESSEHASKVRARRKKCPQLYRVLTMVCVCVAHSGLLTLGVSQLCASAKVAKPGNPLHWTLPGFRLAYSPVL
eukprot:5912286-Amphidinium_carterae.1